MTNEGITRSPPGSPVLDEVLHGGFIAGRLYLVDGNPGAGKTTLALQFLHRGRARRRALPLRHPLGDARRAARPVRASHGWSLDGIEIVELHRRRDAGSTARATHHVPPVGGRAQRRPRARRSRRSSGCKPQRMVFDSLSELRLLAQSSLRYRRQILALKQFFVGRQLHRAAARRPHRRRPRPAAAEHRARRDLARLAARRPTARTLRQLRVVKFRGSDFRSGYHDFLIHRGGLDGVPAPGRGGARQRRSRASRCPAASRRSTRCSAAASTAAPPRCWSARRARASRRSPLQYAAAAARAATTRRSSASTKSRDPAVERAAGLGMPIREGVGTGRDHGPADRPGRDRARRVRPHGAPRGRDATARAWW